MKKAHIHGLSSHTCCVLIYPNAIYIYIYIYIYIHKKEKPKFNYLLIVQLNHVQSKGKAHQISWWYLGNLLWHSR